MSFIPGDGNGNVLTGDQNFAGEDDTIFGYGGSDRLIGLGGEDSLIGGSGFDSLYGGTGSDTLRGDEGEGAGNADRLEGNDGTDLLYGEGGSDTLFGGADNDTLFGGIGNDTLNGGSGADVFVLQEMSGSYANADLISDFSVADGDRIDVSVLGISELATLQFLTSLDGAGMTIATRLYSGTFNTRIDGVTSHLLAANVILNTVASGDVFSGTFAADDLITGLGNDSAYGGQGSDRLFGEAGSDSLVGGTSSDLLFGGGDGDTLLGDGDYDTLFGGAGADLLHGDYDSGATSTDRADSLFGDAGNDTLFGGGRADSLNGGADDDRLTGGAGTDTLTGGTGADVFGAPIVQAYSAYYTQNEEVVTDFSVAEGDRIDVSHLGIADFATVQALLSDTGANLSLQITRDDLTSSLTLQGVANLSSLTAAQFVFDTAETVNNISGSSGRDDLFGGRGADILGGFGSDDRLFGEAGNDTLYGGAFNDRLFGGANDDSLIGGGEADALYGGTGHDVLIGDYFGNSSGNADSLFGGSGNDALDGGYGDDSLVGGNDADTLRGNYGTDTLTGGTGLDVFVVERLSSIGTVDTVTDFSITNDRIDVSELGISEFASVQRFLAGFGTFSRLEFRYDGIAQGLLLQGVGDPSLLTAANFIFSTDTSDNNTAGTTGVDHLFGGLGNDVLLSNGGNDLMFGEAGADQISDNTSGPYATSMFGGSGNDTLEAGYGNDLLEGGADADSLTGDLASFPNAAGDGNDTLRGDAGNDTLRGSGGIDRLYGGADADLLFSGRGNDYMTGGTGADVFEIEPFLTYASADEVDIVTDFSIAGGDRIGLVSLGISEFATVQALLSDLGPNTLLSVRSGLVSAGLQLTGIGDPALLTAAQFQFDTDAADESFTGGSNGDDLFGGLGNDTVYGDYGADRLFGEGGNDSLNGNTDDDSLFGGSNNDTVVGGYGGDSLFGGDGDDVLEGDFVASNSSNDGTDSLFGGNGNDTLAGGAAADILSGGANDDRLRGGAGIDSLTGGTGADVFELEPLIGGLVSGDEIDTVTDFSIAQGDRVDVSLMGISEFATVQALMSIQGGNTRISAIADSYSSGLATGLDLVGIGNPTLLGAAQFLFDTDVTDDSFGGAYYADDLFGGLGNDTLFGAGNTDRLFGEAGLDRLYGGSESDLLFGGADADALYGGYHADRLEGGSGDDDLNGDFGDNAYTNDGADSVYGGTGNDNLFGGGATDRLYGGADADTLRGGLGFDYLTGGTGADVFEAERFLTFAYGADEVDIVGDFSVSLGDRISLGRLGISEFATVQALLSDLGPNTLLSSRLGGFSMGLQLTNIASPTLLGAAQFVFATNVTNDVVGGSVDGDDLFGGLGEDSLDAFGGDDRLFGEAGIDSLFGGGENDSLFGGGDADRAYGGYGTDSLSGGEGADSLFGDFTGGSYAGDGADNLYGGTGNDSMFGGGGDDQLTGGANDDTLTGGNGADTARFSGNWRSFVITGSAATSFVIADQRSGTPDGTDSVSEVESFRFSNGTFTAAQILNDAIAGVNDVDTAIEAGGTANATAGDPTATGNVVTNDTDPDAALGDTKTVTGARTGTEAAGGAVTAVTSTITLTGTYGSLLLNANGAYTYTLNNTDADTQALASGVTVTDAFTYRVSDARGLTDVAQLVITITGANDAPVITSNSGGATAAVSVAENTTAVTTVTATDVDAGATQTYSLAAGGADNALFAINASSGVLTFIAGRNFEAPGDLGGNNVYDVRVQVSDGTATDVQNIAVTVTNANDAPVITSNSGGATAAVSVAENTTAVTTVTATDVDAGATQTYSLAAGGADNALFAINASTGVLTFIAGRNFEAPGDVGANNVYDVRVQVSDGTATDVQNIAVTVTNSALGVVVVGTAGNDTITLSATVVGQQRATEEADSISGLAGNDSLNGGLGNDTLLGGTGNDTLRGDGGADSLDGGADIDLLSHFGSLAAVSVNLATGLCSGGDAAGDTVSGFEIVVGTVFDDTLRGSTGADSLNGSGGNDTLAGDLGNDTLIGGTGNDTIRGDGGADSLSGGEGIDLLSHFGSLAAVNVNLTTGLCSGGDAAGDTVSGFEIVVGTTFDDTIRGSAGAESLSGSSGNDSLIGDLGNDTLAGGTGADRFVFAGAFGNDVIAGFERLVAGEVIDIITIAAITSFADLVANHLTQVGANAVITDGANTITLTNTLTTNLAADDFLF